MGKFWKFKKFNIYLIIGDFYFFYKKPCQCLPFLWFKRRINLIKSFKSFLYYLKINDCAFLSPFLSLISSSFFSNSSFFFDRLLTSSLTSIGGFVITIWGHFVNHKTNLNFGEKNIDKYIFLEYIL